MGLKGAALAVAVWAAGTVPALVAPAWAGSAYVVRQDHWSEADERGFGEFITAIGAARCASVDACLKNPANPFRATDPRDVAWRSDCADLPYVLRFYYAWKRGLPFSYISEISPIGRTRDVRYSPRGNRAEARRDVTTGDNAVSVWNRMRDAVSSATYRIHPDQDDDDFYSPALTQKSIHPGTVIYDPNGHLAIVWKVESDGRIRYIDAHPDNSLTRGFYDLRFVRSSPGMGAGFKNWRPLKLAGTRRDDDVLEGGHAVLTRNQDLADYSETQYFGTGPRPADSEWKSGRFVLNGQTLDYYDYVRAKMAGGELSFDPLKEMRDMVQSNCDDLHYRADAVTDGLAHGLQNQAEPERLPVNIYGTEGDWEDFSTPSRDARLKTAFKQVRDQAARFLAMGYTHDPRLSYGGSHLAEDMLAAYGQAASSCHLDYARSDGSRVTLSYEEARQRLFRLSFDPYQCVERRWGAGDTELATCRDGAVKRAWYAAEQTLRNQLDRTYEARMDWSLAELQRGGSGIGVSDPPDTDVRRYLSTQIGLSAQTGKSAGE